MSTSQWAQERRIVSASFDSGPWRNELAPYLAAIMDAYDDPATEEITITGPARCGKTEATFNMIGKTIDLDPMPIHYATAVEEEIGEVSSERLAPMFQKSPTLCSQMTGRDWDMQGTVFKFKNGSRLFFTGLRSAAKLSSKTSGRLFVTEADKSPDTLPTEGNPIRLAFRRGQTCPDFKAVYDCTLTTEEGFIHVSYNRSNMQKLYVPCPKCGGYQVPKFGRLKVDPPDLRDKEIIVTTDCVYYECEHCNYHIKPSQREWMVARHRWCPEGCTVNRDGTLSGTPKRGKLHQGFWIPPLVSPWQNWAKLLAEWFELQADPINKKGRLREFRNQVMAEVWKEEGTSVSYEHLKKNIGTRGRGIVPDDCKLLAAGVDCHKSDLGEWRLDYMIRGFAPGRKSYVISAGSVESFDAIEEEILMPMFAFESNPSNGLPVDILFVDSGDEAMEIYEWLYPRLGGVAWPTKGIDFLPQVFRKKVYTEEEEKKRRKKGRSIKNNLIGMEWYDLGTNELKNKVAMRLAKELGAPDSIEFYQSIPHHVLSQICGEHKIKERRRGRVVEVWEPKAQHGDVHFWDTLILTEAAGYIRKAWMLEADDATPENRLPAALRNRPQKRRVRLSEKPRRRI